MESELTFALDSNLNRLGEWLRLLGYDTKISNHSGYEELWRWHLNENRILLTKSTHLIKRKPIGNHLLISSNDLLLQLETVIRHFKLSITPTFHRCLRCNDLLIPILRESSKALVPALVWLTTSHFWSCPHCIISIGKAAI